MKKQDYTLLGKEIVKNVGGKDNITYLAHCVTRLRFNVKDESIINTEAIKNLNGVMGTATQNGQFQIIIGDRVTEVYDEVCKIAEIKDQFVIDENLDQKKKAKALDTVMDIISGSFAPIVSSLAGAGFLKGILTLLTTYHLMATDTGFYLVMNAAADAVFYFLPFLLAYSSSKKFNTDTPMAMVLAGILMYPTIIGGAGTASSFLGFNFSLVKYSSTVIPIFISVWIMSYVHKFMQKYSPSFLRVVLVPLGVLIIMAPLSVCVIGPIGYNLGTYVSKFLTGLFELSPLLGGLIYGASRQLIVFTGTHMALIPMALQNLETVGYDLMSPVSAVSTTAVAGTCFGVFLKAKKTNNKTTSLSACISALIGITEPALYGVAFCFKKPLIAVIVGGGVAGAFVAAMGAKAISFGLPALISLPAYSQSIPTMLIGMAIAFSLSAVLAYLLGFEEGNEKNKKNV